MTVTSTKKIAIRRQNLVAAHSGGANRNVHAGIILIGDSSVVRGAIEKRRHCHRQAVKVDGSAAFESGLVDVREVLEQRSGNHSAENNRLLVLGWVHSTGTQWSSLWRSDAPFQDRAFGLQWLQTLRI